MALTTSWKNYAKKTWTGSSGAKITFYLDAKYTKQSIANNNTAGVYTRLRSTVDVGSASGSGYTFTCTYCDKVSGTGVWNFEDETIMTSPSKTITHNSDGTKSLSLSATVKNTYLGIDISLSATVELPTIPRASTIACSSPYIGDTATITISKKATGFTNTVTYKIGTLTGTIATKTSETVLSLETESLKEQIYALIPNAKETTGTITCITYNGDTQIGDATTANFNLYAKEADCKPEVSGTIVDTSEAAIALTGDSSKLIKYISKPKVTVTATAKNSATISGYSINLNDGQSSTLQEDTFESIGSNSITVDATDSRGCNNPQTIALDMIEYVKLHIDNIDISRTEDVSNEVVLNANGVWFNGNFNGNTPNTLTASFQYKSNEDTEWTNGGVLTPTVEGNAFTFTNVSLGNTYNFNNEYQFKIILSDLLTTVGSENKESITVSRGQEVVAIGEDTVWIYGDLFIGDSNGENEKEIRDLFFPIGSTYVTSKNESPASYLGGEWEPIGKGFEEKYKNDTSGDLFTMDTTKISSYQVALTRSDSSIRIRFNCVLNVDVEDATVILGKLNLENLGISRLPSGYNGMASGNDTGNCIFVYNVAYDDGEISITDVVGKTENKIPSGTTIYLDFTFANVSSYMLDNACNKFYWKRKA